MKNRDWKSRKMAMCFMTTMIVASVLVLGGALGVHANEADAKR